MARKISTERFDAVLQIINQAVSDQGYPPTVREIGRQMGVSSSSTIAKYLDRMLEAGLISKDPAKPRALEITEKGFARIGVNPRGIPIIGTVAAGVPITAIQNIDDYFPLPSDLNYDASELFILRVQGSSMINIGILDGDQIIVKRQNEAEDGQIIVALTDDNEATVKRFYKEANQIRLHPENDTMADMYFDNIQILGIVVSLYRPSLV